MHDQAITVLKKYVHFCVRVEIRVVPDSAKVNDRSDRSIPNIDLIDLLSALSYQL